MTSWLWVVVGYLLAAAVWMAYAVWSGRGAAGSPTERDR